MLLPQSKKSMSNRKINKSGGETSQFLPFFMGYKNGF